MAAKSSWEHSGVSEMFCDSIVVVVPLVCTFCKTDQTVYLK